MAQFLIRLLARELSPAPRIGHGAAPVILQFLCNLTDMKYISFYEAVKMAISPAQCRAARALIEMSQIELADAAGVSSRTVLDFETNKRQPIKVTLSALQRSLEEAGVEFTNGDQPGVRLAKPKKNKR
jgi:DNA-binding XRE family transcriptional regulator